MPQSFLFAGAMCIGISCLCPRDGLSQKVIRCPDGDRIQMDLARVSIQYQASSFSATLNGLGTFFGVRIGLEPKTIQRATAATQKWNEYIKALVAGFNSCAISKEQYSEGVQRIYPRLKDDAASLERIRLLILAGQHTDEARLRTIIESYLTGMKQFASVSGSAKLFERIDRIAQRTTSVEETQSVLADRLAKLEQTVALLTPPSEVKTKIGQQLSKKAEDAEAAYNKGYSLLSEYRFEEAIPFFREALATIQLPDFYLGLGMAYFELPDLARAETVILEGFQLADRNGDQEQIASLSIALSRIRVQQGNLPQALLLARRAFSIDSALRGPDDPYVALDASNIALILKEQGRLSEAAEYAQHAFAILARSDSTRSEIPVIARTASLIHHAQSNLPAALWYALQALHFDERMFGPDDADVGSDLNNIAVILQDRGDWKAALPFALRSLEIAMKVYSPDHPRVADVANTVGSILRGQNRLDEALVYTMRALTISKKTDGPIRRQVARYNNNIAGIYKAQNDLPRALQHALQALCIGEKAPGTPHQDIALYANNVGGILEAQGDFSGALNYIKRALAIVDSIYGPNHLSVALYSNNVGQILLVQKDFVGALEFTERALRVLESILEKDHPMIQGVARNLDYIKRSRDSK